MDSLLFPDWMMFAGFFLFLKIYSPTRLYLDNVTCVAIAYALVVSLSFSGLKITVSFTWVVSVVIFSLFASVPYWLGGMLGSVIQQMLLLNEQSVQDTRFTEETESLSKMGGLMSIMYGVKYGAVFYPLLDLFHKSLSSQLDASFDKLYYLIVDN
ncbi:type III secretion system apparatus protein VscT2, partial [Citrobacter portucalensis]|uniref:type III secretion system apparatus protein VscT2 n=1 Tax=Citrobacter portucalensis TaxID=1639133 RepID=UPI00226B64BA